ncbi:MAG TPA: ATP-binding protein [Candidatus Acidoferrales bacterium]
MPESISIDAKRHVPGAKEGSADRSGAVRGFAQRELSGEERAKLLDVKAWDPILEMYGRTMQLAVALTDPDGSLLGTCHNAQPMWSALRGSMIGKQTGCPFCLSPPSPCNAVVDALHTGLPKIVCDAAGLMHVAVPLLLGGHPLGAILAGQVPSEYPDPLFLQRASKTFGVSQQLLWSLSNKQHPVTRQSLRSAGDLLHTLGQAFVQQRYGTLLEAHVADTNAQFRLLVDGVTDYALFTTDDRGRVTSWNSGGERMLGYHEDEIIGEEFSRMFTPEDVQNGVPEKQLLKASQNRRAESEGWRIRKNGTRFWADVIITALEGEGGRRGFAVVMQDVTDRRKAAIELESVRQERMTLQEQFLSHVSHELRTPLTAIYFFITNLLEGVNGDLSPGQRETLESSLENINQLKDMVSDLLDISRVDSHKLSVDPQHMHVPGLIQEVLRTCRANAKLKDINLAADVTPSLPAAWADRARVRQVLINLIDNAIRFTPERGTVAVRARVFAEDSSFLCLSVVDTGCGISPADCLTVFDRLAQVKSTAESSRKGLGLGLFIAKELVMRLGGRIWVESRLQEGSTFSFTLPVFSLGKFCDVLFTPANLAAGCVGLFSIDVPAIEGGVPQQQLPALRKVLERCITAGRDLLLPAMTEAEATKTFFVIACTDTKSAESVSECFRRELDNFYHGSKLQPVVSATHVQLASREQPWAERKAEAVNKIDKLIQAHVRERSASN